MAGKRIIMETVIEVRGLSKGFTLHTQGDAHIPVFCNLDITVHKGRCTALYGPSGSGKSSLLRCLYANYLPQKGSVMVRHQGGWVDMATARPHQVLEVRKQTMGYVSQFLRVIPRVASLDIVADPLADLTGDRKVAREKAHGLLSHLRIPERLFDLAPATFSGGEQQRVNIARGFIVGYPIMLLDEPTASLDARNRQTVIELIQQAKARGTAIVGIFHDDEVREAVSDEIFYVEEHQAAA
jgi:alpha-D-ribose 1-methylphosphonate 5-triphosphate synthase subunit PhnL